MKQWISYIVIVILSVCLVLSLTHKKEVIFEKHTTDTITVIRTDTIRTNFPKFIYKTITDTILVDKTHDNVLKLPITQLYYSTDLYQAWVSGYKPRLDSINVFNRIIERKVTNTVAKEIYPKTCDWYLNAGSMIINNKAAPYIGLNVKFKNDIMLGANVGYFNKKTIYGVNIGLKLNK